MGNSHECTPPQYPLGWGGWDCPVCDTHWIHDLSYHGPGYINPIYRWERMT